MDATEPAADPNTLDYVINEENGSCMCKLCGEVVSSRTHWYRHKYKVRSSHAARRRKLLVLPSLSGSAMCQVPRPVLTFA